MKVLTDKQLDRAVRRLYSLSVQLDCGSREIKDVAFYLRDCALKNEIACSTVQSDSDLDNDCERIEE